MTIRHEGLVTSLSWIPTEAIEGAQRLAFDSGITHYDPPPPTESMDVEQLRDEDRFRFANKLRAFVVVDDGGQIVDCGYLGGGLMGSTMVNLGAAEAPLPGRAAARHAARARVRGGLGPLRPDLRRPHRRPRPPAGAPPAVRPVASAARLDHAALTIHADGRTEHELIGASRFPRHWVYGADRRSHKSGLTDFKDWYRKSFGKHSPWGDEDSEALVSAVESALETALSSQLMQGTASVASSAFRLATSSSRRVSPAPTSADPRRDRPGGAGRRAPGRVRAGRAAR
jgi:hypothetical protein